MEMPLGLVLLQAIAIPRRPPLLQPKSKPDLLNSSFASPASMLHCTYQALCPSHSTYTDFSQSLLGAAPRTHNHNHLWVPHRSRTLHLLHLPKHHSIHFRRSRWLHLPPPLVPKRRLNPLHLSQSLNPLPSNPRRHNLLPCLPFRLRLPRPHRLHNLHPRKILQAPPRHVPPLDYFSKIIPSLQISRRSARDHRRSSIHTLPSIFVLEEIFPEQGQFSMGPHATSSQPPLRRSYEQHSRSHLQHLPHLHRPSNDGCAERPLHCPHSRLSSPLASSSTYAPQSLRTKLRVLSRSVIHSTQPSYSTRYPLFRCMRCYWTNLHLLHTESL